MSANAGPETMGHTSDEPSPSDPESSAAKEIVGKSPMRSSSSRPFPSICGNYLWQPLLGLVALVLSLALLGEATRDALDPKTRR